MNKKQLAREYPPPGEQEYIDDLSRRLREKIARENPDGLMLRDAHPKMHGLVKAEFIVESGLPGEAQVGLFAAPGTYKAWIRFSNQMDTISPDIKGDIRGMAIKLMGVEGEKLLDDERDALTQDFVLISTPVFVTRNVSQFDKLIKAFAGNGFTVFLFFLFHWRAGWNLWKSMKKCANPLQIRYWSTTPYLFGDVAVKYSAVPHGDTTDTIPANAGDNFLREAMTRQLDKGEATFDFMVQRQNDARTMPIEDPGKAWHEGKSPFIKVATIRIPAQSFDTEAQRNFGENLSFTPWHSLVAHRPLGGINRARKVVYRAISLFRHEKNNLPRSEPVDWNF